MYSYNNLWKKMIDLGMERKDLMRRAGISATTLTRMKQGSAISYDVCRRICEVIDCSPEDIIEYVE
ncbi:MAG: helix-turn-helix domain-containing protein [Lachnospiraceae bacterium]|nr:helix-turn-helix domain-containing protein [Lachnospiraceae bacterium]